MSTADPVIPPSGLDPAIARGLKRDAQGLIAAVAQQWDTGEVLMLAWMDDEALHRTLSTGAATYFSRSRKAYWVKGETSGHRQWVRSMALDCDGDALLLRVDQEGPACHTGSRSCFGASSVQLTIDTSAPAQAAPLPADIEPGGEDRPAGSEGGRG